MAIRLPLNQRGRVGNISWCVNIINGVRAEAQPDVFNVIDVHLDDRLVKVDVDSTGRGHRVVEHDVENLASTAVPVAVDTGIYFSFDVVLQRSLHRGQPSLWIVGTHTIPLQVLLKLR